MLDLRMVFKFLIIISGILSSSFTHAEWGAEPLNSSYRTDQSWENTFPSVPNVTVSPGGTYPSIHSGVAYCNTLPANEYCYIKVASGSYYGDPNDSDTYLYINRSNMKISGSTDINGNRTSKLISGDDAKSFIYLGSVSNLVIENLSLVGRTISTDYSETYTSKRGITAYASGLENITIRNNLIQGVKVDLIEQNAAGDNFRNGASAISITGTGDTEANAIKNVLIKNNIVIDMHNGHSENISVGGNITRWEIKNNTIKDVTNIGIDAAGGYKDSSTHLLDAARYGFIENNTVTNLQESPSNIDGVAAIYVDGGNHIHIEGNKTGRTSAELAAAGLPSTYKDISHGYTIGAEECVVTSHVTLINNESYNATFEDLSIGGYGSTGYTDIDDCAHKGNGSVENITVTNNTFDSPNATPNSPARSESFPIQVLYRITSAIINQDGVVESNQNGDGSAPEGENAIKKTVTLGVPEITSPVLGSVLSGASLDFTWNSNGTSALGWEVHIGTPDDPSKYHNPNTNAPGDGAATSYTADSFITPLPTDGSTILVTLWWLPPTIGASWQNVTATYTAGPGLPTITSPTAGSVLSGTSVNFTWNANGTSTLGWEVHIGTPSNPSKYHRPTSNAPGDGAATSYTVGNFITPLPTEGSPILVSLWWLPSEAGSSWQKVTKTYSSAQLTGVVMDDAEDGTIGDWKVYDQAPTGATIENIPDAASYSRVISLSGAGKTNGYRLGHHANRSDAWNDTSHKIISWDMSFNENFIIQITVDTLLGQRWLKYTQSTNSAGITSSPKVINHGLGATSKNGYWQRINRHLELDLQEFEPENEIISVNGMFIRGSGKVDNIRLLDSLPPTIYEDGQDAVGWDVFDNLPAGALVDYTADEDKNSNVIVLQGDKVRNGYRLGNGITKWNNRHQNVISWDMKYAENYIIYVNTLTTSGQRYLKYTQQATDLGITGSNSNYIHHGLGSITRDGQWQTVTRNLLSDLKDFEPDNEILSINGFLIKGSGRLDNLVLSQ